MNVILIVADTFRYDNLFDRATIPVITPHLDAFAERAVSFSNMYTGSFPTTSHRRELASGRWGPEFSEAEGYYLPANFLPVLLKEAGGHVTQFLCDCPHLSDFGSRFDAAHYLRGQEGDVYFLRMNHPIEPAMPPEKTRSGAYFQGHNLVDLHRWTNRWWRGEKDRFPARLADLAVEWLEENHCYHPVLLWVDCFDPHEPWDPPEDMVRRYDPDYDGPPMLHPNYGYASDLTEAELRNLHAHYCAEVELVDRHLGRILQKIDDLSLWEQSIVVFTTDHGTSLGEHDRTGKGNRNDCDDRLWPVYPEIAHIPCMIAAPGLKGGRAVDQLAQPADILPTLADLADLTLAPPDPLHGRSCAALLRGESSEPVREFVLSGFTDFLTKRGHTEPPVMYTDRWAYVPVGVDGSRELYDLSVDPLATNDVHAGQAEVVDRLHEKLVNWLHEVGVPHDQIRLFDNPGRETAWQRTRYSSTRS